MRRSHRLAAIATLAALNFGAQGTAVAAPTDRVAIPDAVLSACIANELGVPSAPSYTEAQMESIWTLGLCPGVAKLDGLEHAVNLQVAYLWNGTITDVAPAAAIQSLVHLNLSNNNISDVTPFKLRKTGPGYEPMTLLSLDGNHVSDLSFFTYAYTHHASLQAKLQTVTVAGVVTAGVPTAVPIKGDGVTAAELKLELPAGAARSGSTLTYDSPGTYTIKFIQHTDWADENGDPEYFSGTFTQTVQPAVALTAFAPKIAGTARVKKTLKVRMSAWAPAPVKMTYRWLRNDSAISGATKSSYKITKKDRKKRISVKVTGIKVGFQSVSKTSPKTAKVK